MTTNGVCIDRWYVMIIFSCLKPKAHENTMKVRKAGNSYCHKRHGIRHSVRYHEKTIKFEKPVK